MGQSEIEKWEKDLDEYISQVKDDCEQYAYSRKNAWRKALPDGSEYDLDSCDYNSEQEYMKALNEEKYGWREWYKGDDTLVRNVNSFETLEEFPKAYTDLLNEKQKKAAERT